MGGMGVGMGSVENSNASCFARSASLSLSFVDHSEEVDEGSFTYPDPLFRHRIPEQDMFYHQRFNFSRTCPYS
jgi:hypothetical protein